jgi:hypothetical protein
MGYIAAQQALAIIIYWKCTLGSASPLRTGSRQDILFGLSGEQPLGHSGLVSVCRAVLFTRLSYRS